MMVNIAASLAAWAQVPSKDLPWSPLGRDLFCKFGKEQDLTSEVEETRNQSVNLDINGIYIYI